MLLMQEAAAEVKEAGSSPELGLKNCNPWGSGLLQGEALSLEYITAKLLALISPYNWQKALLWNPDLWLIYIDWVNISEFKGEKVETWKA